MPISSRFFLAICFTLFMTATQAQEFKVMSYNIRLDVKADGENSWDMRKDRLTDLVKFYAPDFAGMQEVQYHQLQYIQKKLPNYAYIGVGRDDGKTGGEYSCIFYNKERFKAIQTSTFWLSPTPDSVSKGWDAAYNRVCTYGLFKDLKTKKRFWVLNTHFDHIGNKARAASARLIMQKIKELNTKHYPVILTGDFNLHPEEEPIQYINSNMNNARELSEFVYGNVDTWNAFKFHEKPTGNIDYIFVSNDARIKVLSFATLTDSYDMKYPSDHFPIMATLKLN